MDFWHSVMLQQKTCQFCTQKSCNFLLLYFILCCVQHLAPSPVTINIVLLLECYVWEFSSFFYMSDCFLCKCLWFYVLAVLLALQLQFFSLRRISITKLWSLSFILLLLRLHRGFYCFLWIFPIVPPYLSSASWRECCDVNVLRFLSISWAAEKGRRHAKLQ